MIEKLQLTYEEAETEIKVHRKKSNQIYKPFNLEFSLKIIQKERKKERKRSHDLTE